MKIIKRINYNDSGKQRLELRIQLERKDYLQNLRFYVFFNYFERTLKLSSM